MAEAALCNVAEVILTNMGARSVREIADVWGFKTQLEKLNKTINTIKNMLLDAETRQHESHVVRGWLERITHLVYDADDLFDEVSTLLSQKESMTGNNFTKELRVFFSDCKRIALAFSLSRKTRKIREELDDIANDGNQFGFVLRPYEERHDTMSGIRCHSYIDSHQVIGRDEDKRAILDMLLISSSANDGLLDHVSVIPIVGIGGLAKTALAQYVYNDVKVKDHFELRLWVCVSDMFDIGEVIRKILMSATDTVPDQLEIDQLQGRLRRIVGGKRFLLVLDDVWNEDREKWLELRAVLNNGRDGSTILVTTRSGLVAKIMGTFPPYNLHVLSEEKSWDLFEKLAFEKRQDQRRQVFEKLGKEIVKKCGNVPLAIRALGSLLYGQDERKWLSLKDKSLVEISTGNDVMSILRLSYLNLWSPLKLCFAYCSLFPKDYELEPKTLINLWMAEGFIITTDESQNLEDIGEEYFSVLLQRCFFQDICRDELGNIKSCKLHDLMHDLANDVAGADSKLMKFGETVIRKSFRHLSIGYSLNSLREIPGGVLDLKLLRTFLLPTQIKDGSSLCRSTLNQMISSFRRLRVMDLHNLEVTTLPSSICNMVHLRYLNLSMTPIRTLPESIAELQNLQTVELYACYRLERLPTNIRKLTNLRNLDVDECPHLTHMPSGLRELTSLRRLTRFTVNYRSRPTSLCKPTAQLRDLKTLENLKGSLRIEILGELEDPLSDAKEANLRSKHGLTELRIHGATWPNKGSGDKHDEALLEGLKPHHNLRKLEILGFRGKKLPSWANMHNLVIYLPYLIEISLQFCRRWLTVPVFSRLPFLKRLYLVSLWSVEYMEDEPSELPPSSSSSSVFFPSLTELKLTDMRNLKGWWKQTGLISEDQSRTTFSNLSTLCLRNCPNLTSMPLCPNVEELWLENVNVAISVSNMLVSISKKGDDDNDNDPSTSASSKTFSNLKTVCADNMTELLLLPDNCLLDLSSLVIRDTKLSTTSCLGQIFHRMPSLRCLSFVHCDGLISFSQGLENLSALEYLHISDCKELHWSSNEDQDNGMPWKALNNLQSLSFYRLPKLSALPSGIQHLTNLGSLHLKGNEGLAQLPLWISCLKSLEHMTLHDCPKLTSLPEGFEKLTNLQQLDIIQCPVLAKRCERETGQDREKIKNIPIVRVLNNMRESGNSRYVFV